MPITDYDERKELRVSSDSSATGLDDFESGSAELSGLTDSVDYNVTSNSQVYGSYSLEAFTDRSTGKEVTADLESNISTDGKTLKFSFKGDTQTGDNVYGYSLVWRRPDGQDTLEIYFDLEGRIGVYDNGAYTQVGTWSTGQVYDIEMVVDFTNNQHEIFINGSSQGTYGFGNVGGQDTSASEFESIYMDNRVGAGASSSTVYIDNLTYTNEAVNKKAQPVTLVGNDYTGFDGFESGSSELNWEGLANFSIDSNSEVYLNNSLLLSSSNDSVGNAKDLSSPVTGDGKKVVASVKIDNQTGNSSDSVQIGLVDGVSILTEVEFVGNGDITAGSGDSVVGSWSQGTIYDVEIVVDFTNDQYDLIVNGDTLSTGLAFDNSGSDVDDIDLTNITSGSGGTVNAFFDRLTYTSKVENTVNAGGLVGYDSSTVAGAQDVAFYDSNGNLLDYEIENPGDLGSSSAEVVAWIYTEYSRDNNNQVNFAFGNNDAATDRSSEAFDSADGYELVELMEDTTGSDDSDNGRDATVTGTSSVSGQFADGLDFNGSGDELDFGDITALKDEPVTWSFWMNPDSINDSSTEPVFSARGSGGDSSFEFTQPGDGTLDFDVTYSTGENSVITSSAPGNGSWHFVTAAVDSKGGVEYFVDGSSEGVAGIGSDETGVDNFETGSSELNWESATDFTIDSNSEMYSTYSLQVNSSNQDLTEIKSWSNNITEDGVKIRFSLKIDNQTGNSSDTTPFLRFSGSDGVVLDIVFDGSGTIKDDEISGNTLGSWSAGQVDDYEVVLDFTNDVFDLVKNGTTIAADVAFVQSVSDVGSMNITHNTTASGSTVNVFFDRVTYDANIEDVISTSIDNVKFGTDTAGNGWNGQGDHLVVRSRKPFESDVKAEFDASLKGDRTYFVQSQALKVKDVSESATVSDALSTALTRKDSPSEVLSLSGTVSTNKAQLTGKVVLGLDQALQGVEVYAVRESDRKFLGYDTTDSNGDYSISIGPATSGDVILVGADYYDSGNDRYFGEEKSINYE